MGKEFEEREPRREYEYLNADAGQYVAEQINGLVNPSDDGEVSMEEWSGDELGAFLDKLTVTAESMVDAYASTIAARVLATRTARNV